MPKVRPSRFPADGSWLDRVDKSVTSQVGRLELGWLEAPLSFPGCIFGSPLILLVGPLLVATAHGATHGPAVRGEAAAVLLLLLAAMVAGWARFLWTGDEDFVRRCFYSANVFLLSPPGGVVLAGALASSDAGFQRGASCVTLWMLSIIPIFAVKQAARRRRPVVCEDCLTVCKRRRLEAICKILRTDANAAFPSGDVAGAAAIALPLWVATGSVLAPALCVALSALGRVYWRAHHVLDVVAGGLTTAAVAEGLKGMGWGLGQPLHWTQPLLAWLTCTLFFLAVRWQMHRAKKARAATKREAGAAIVNRKS